MWVGWRAGRQKTSVGISPRARAASFFSLSLLHPPPTSRSPAAWEAADFPDPAAYTTVLSAAHLAELEALAATVAADASKGSGGVAPPAPADRVKVPASGVG